MKNMPHIVIIMIIGSIIYYVMHVTIDQDPD